MCLIEELVLSWFHCNPTLFCNHLFSSFCPKVLIILPSSSQILPASHKNVFVEECLKDTHSHKDVTALNQYAAYTIN